MKRKRRRTKPLSQRKFIHNIRECGLTAAELEEIAYKFKEVLDYLPAGDGYSSDDLLEKIEKVLTVTEHIKTEEEERKELIKELRERRRQLQDGI